jgi:hypothetical protein
MPTDRSLLMNLGLRALLLIAAVILFVFAAMSDSNYGDLLAWGLACLAGALLVGETGFARLGGKR